MAYYGVRDVSRRCVGAVNSRYEWVAQTLGVTFVDPNSWLDDWNFGRDLFVIANVKQLRTGGSFGILLPFFPIILRRWHPKFSNF